MAKVTIQYRQLKTEDLWPEVELKAMVVDVLRRQRSSGQEVPRFGDSAKLRIVDIDQDGSFVILNKISAPSAWDGPVLAGQLIHLQQGSDVHAVMQSLEDDTAEFVVQSLTVGEQARVLKGALYFAILDNHVGLIEGQQVRGRMLERYLTKILQDADEIEAGQAIILNAKFATGDGKELSASDEIEMSAGPGRGSGMPATVHGREGSVPIRPDETGDVVRETGREKGEGATVFDILELLGWSPEALKRLRADVPDDGWLEGFFRFFIKQKNRRKPISRGTINEALRNIDVADLGMRSGEGREKGGVVKLSAQRNVVETGSLLVGRVTRIEGRGA